MIDDIAFVVNRKSGPNRKIEYKKCIHDAVGDNATIIYWESIEQVAKEVNRLIDEGIKTIVAIGGDGTISYIASLLANKNVTLCIIPMGSGNGLARHLSIPLEINKALSLLSTGKTISVDSVKINGRRFFSVAGVGFDAHIANVFLNSKKRGYLTYVQMILVEFFKFKCKKYTITIGGKSIETDAFAVSICNANQYGNDIRIAPQADSSDGEVDIVVLKPLSFFRAVQTYLLIITGNIKESKYLQFYKGKAGEITMKDKDDVHFDGEMERMGPDLSFEVDPGSLKVLVPK